MYGKEVVDIIQEAEKKLTDHMHEALDRSAFEDVAAIAAVSARLRSLIDDADGPAVETGSTVSNNVEVERGRRAKRRSSRGASKRAKDDYPRFERDNNRLVKIGWSKRERAEYAHKAPRTAVEAVVMALRANGHNVFSMEELLPITTASNGEVPSYQAYLVTAWLRACGAVEREGRGGYRPVLERLTDEIIDQQWAALVAVNA